MKKGDHNTMQTLCKFADDAFGCFAWFFGLTGVKKGEYKQRSCTLMDLKVCLLEVELSSGFKKIGNEAEAHHEGHICISSSCCGQGAIWCRLRESCCKFATAALYWLWVDLDHLAFLGRNLIYEELELEKCSSSTKFSYAFTKRRKQSCYAAAMVCVRG
ncbi:hypothetical protein VNO80_10273 [Phaseolus coccineus]|uniref:Uncharacterized protein n=1 Tax=Phaseolus coccineus TaxID=3886 RepID=A0AAN9N7U2_PHACN